MGSEERRPADFLTTVSAGTTSSCAPLRWCSRHSARRIPTVSYVAFAETGQTPVREHVRPRTNDAAFKLR